MEVLLLAGTFYRETFVEGQKYVLYEILLFFSVYPVVMQVDSNLDALGFFSLFGNIFNTSLIT
jgi:hypothetical protein